MGYERTINARTGRESGIRPESRSIPFQLDREGNHNVETDDGWDTALTRHEVVPLTETKWDGIATIPPGFRATGLRRVRVLEGGWSDWADVSTSVNAQRTQSGRRKPAGDFSRSEKVCAVADLIVEHLELGLPMTSSDYDRSLIPWLVAMLGASASTCHDAVLMLEHDEVVTVERTGARGRGVNRRILSISLVRKAVLV